MHKIIPRFATNNKNYLFDGNIDLLVERANGQYVWFLGCGEIVKSNAIQHTLKYLQQDFYDTVLLNFDAFSEVENRINEIANPLKENKIFLEKGAFLAEFGLRSLTALSSNIIAKYSWQKVKNIPLQEKGWCHVERIAEILRNPEYLKSLFIAELCFTLYRETDGWWTTKAYFSNFLTYLKLAKYFDDHFKIPARQLLGHIYRTKLLGISINIQSILFLTRIFKNRPDFWMLAFPFLFFPQILLRFLFQIARFIYRNSGMKLIKNKLKSKH